MFETSHRRLTRVARLAATLGGLGVLCIAILVTTEVLIRRLFDTTLGGVTEIAGLIFVVATALAYPFMLLDRANIRIDVLYARFAPKWRALFDLVALLALLYFVVMLTQSAFALLSKSWTNHAMTNGVLHLPLWIPQLLWVFGLMLFALTALFLLCRVIVHLVRRDWDAVARVAGIPSIQEETQDNIHEANTLAAQSHAQEAG